MTIKEELELLNDKILLLNLNDPSSIDRVNEYANELSILTECIAVEGAFIMGLSNLINFKTNMSYQYVN